MSCDNVGVTMRLIGILMLLGASAAAQPWTTGTITYDGAGNITAMGADTFLYDSAGRLVKGTADPQRTGGSNRQDYSYDAFGNRLTVDRFGADCVGGCPSSAVAVSATTNRITDHGASYDPTGSLSTFNPIGDGSANSTFTYAYD